MCMLLYICRGLCVCHIFEPCYERHDDVYIVRHDDVRIGVIDGYYTKTTYADTIAQRA